VAQDCVTGFSVQNERLRKPLVVVCGPYVGQIWQSAVATPARLRWPMNCENTYQATPRADPGRPCRPGDRGPYSGRRVRVCGHMTDRSWPVPAVQVTACCRAAVGSCRARAKGGACQSQAHERSARGARKVHGRPGAARLLGGTSPAQGEGAAGPPVKAAPGIHEAMCRDLDGYGHHYPHSAAIRDSWRRSAKSEQARCHEALRTERGRELPERRTALRASISRSSARPAARFGAVRAAAGSGKLPGDVALEDPDHLGLGAAFGH
jgi:hypothetical protein